MEFSLVIIFFFIATFHLYNMPWLLSDTTSTVNSFCLNWSNNEWIFENMIHEQKTIYIKYFFKF